MIDNLKREGIIQWLRLYPHILKQNNLQELYRAEAETMSTMERLGDWERWDLTRFLINSLGLPRVLNNLDKIPSYFLSEDGGQDIKKVNIPSHILSIGRSAFNKCPIEYINLGDVKSIRTRAFEECNIKSVIIPETVETIYPRVFKDNPLTHVYFNKDCEAHIRQDIFEGCPIEEIKCNQVIKSQLSDYLQEKVILI